MSEINELLGIGDKFLIDGVEYEAHIATFEELEDIEKKTEGLFLKDEGIRFNFLKMPDEPDNTLRNGRVKRLTALLQTIFPDAPVEKLKKLSRKEVARAISYFLFD